MLRLVHEWSKPSGAGGGTVGGGEVSGYTSGYGTPDEVVARRDRLHTDRNRCNDPATDPCYGPATKEVWIDATQPRFMQYSDPAYWAIRGREQQLIDSHGGAKSDHGTSGNDKRGYAKANPLGPLFHMASDTFFGPLHTGY